MACLRPIFNGDPLKNKVTKTYFLIWCLVNRNNVNDDIKNTCQSVIHNLMSHVSYLLDIIDLEQTVPLMQQALDVTAHVVYRGGMVLFLSRHLQTLPWVERMARDVGEYSHCRPWSKGNMSVFMIPLEHSVSLNVLFIVSNILKIICISFSNVMTPTLPHKERHYLTKGSIFTNFNSHYI